MTLGPLVDVAFKGALIYPLCPSKRTPRGRSHSDRPCSRHEAVKLTRMSPLAVGDTAPDFELPIRGTERFHLADALQKGPVVLLTYILDFSPG